MATWLQIMEHEKPHACMSLTLLAPGCEQPPWSPPLVLQCAQCHWHGAAPLWIVVLTATVTSLQQLAGIAIAA